MNHEFIVLKLSFSEALEVYHMVPKTTVYCMAEDSQLLDNGQDQRLDQHDQ